MIEHPDPIMFDHTFRSRRIIALAPWPQQPSTTPQEVPFLMPLSWWHFHVMYIPFPVLQSWVRPIRVAMVEVDGSDGINPFAKANERPVEFPGGGRWDSKRIPSISVRNNFYTNTEDLCRIP
eukprot:scaffold10199_cov146-Cylindrotheca_fusiformis.AAC.37